MFPSFPAHGNGRTSSGPLGQRMSFPANLGSPWENRKDSLRINTLNTDSQPMPPSKRNAQHLPLKATHACAGKPGRAVSAWAAVGGDLGLMVFGCVPSARKRGRVPGGAVRSVTLPSVQQTFERFRKRYAASFCVLFAFLEYHCNVVGFFKKLSLPPRCHLGRI